MDLLVHQILSGLATGGIYASLALALVMIYQATHLVNFAQGEIAMFATYLAWTLIQAGVPYWGAFFITVISAFVGGFPPASLWESPSAVGFGARPAARKEPS